MKEEAGERSESWINAINLRLTLRSGAAAAPLPPGGHCGVCALDTAQWTLSLLQQGGEAAQGST